MALTICLAAGTAFAQQNAKGYITQGQEHMKQGNYAEAVAAYEAALKLEPRNRQVPPLLKTAQEKRMEEAFTQGQNLQQEGKFSEAITLYNSAIRYAPPGTNTRNIQNRRDEAQKSLALAEQQELRALADQEQQAQAQTVRERAELSHQAIQRANDLFIAGKYLDAIAQYEHAVNLSGLNAAETTETQRLIAEAQDVQAKLESYSGRALKDDDFEVSQNTNGTVTLTKYKASESKTVNIGGVSHTVSFGILNVVIPARIWGVNLTAIGNEAFKNTGITSVVIPDTVTEIGFGAFYGNKLERVVIGRGIKVIKGGVAQGRMEVSELGAFEGNANLTEILIPDTVTEIGARAFKDCGLTSVTLGRAVAIIGESAFRNNKLPVITLPATIRTIRRFAFHQNQIQALTLPNGILEVFDDAFTNNPMTAVVIPASLATMTTINGLACPRIGGDHAHYSAFTPTFPDTLVRVTLPANMQPDNMRTFEENLRNYYISSNRVTGTYVKNGPIWTR
jgi:tetratricopeptide (TPR) repeat protein